MTGGGTYKGRGVARDLGDPMPSDAVSEATQPARSAIASLPTAAPFRSERV